MTRLVSLEQAKLHLRIQDVDTDGHPDDPDLELKIEAASRAVLRYIESSDPAFLDTAGEPLLDTAGEPIGIPDDVKAATLVLVGDLYREREGTNASEWEHGFLPVVVRSLLYPYRLPTLA